MSVFRAKNCGLKSHFRVSIHGRGLLKKSYKRNEKDCNFSFILSFFQYLNPASSVLFEKLTELKPANSTLHFA